MKRLRKVAELLLLFVFIGFILLLAVLALRGARKLSHTVDDLDRTIIITAGAARNLELGARAWQQSSKEQSAGATLAFQNLNASAKSLNRLIASTDSSLNASLLPDLAKSIKEQNAALLSTQAALQSDLEGAGQVTARAVQTIEDADKVISDPSIHISLDNLATASQNAGVATSEAAASMTKVHEAVVFEVRQLEAPVSKIKAISLIVVRLVGRFFGF